jgi:signal transduction histidine kinase
LLDSLPDAVLVVNDAGLVLAANRLAVLAWGGVGATGMVNPAQDKAQDQAQVQATDPPQGAAHSLIGQPLRSLAGADLAALIAEAQAGTSLSRHVTRADGSRWAVELSVGHWPEAGRQLHTLQFRDLEAARRVERMKDEFLATVSHELRTPLTSLLGALGLMVSGAAGALPTAMQPLADAAQRNGQRLGQLIDDVLDLTKLEGDRLSLRPVSVRLDRLLREAIDANQGYAQRGQVRLTLQLDPELDEVEFRLDPHRFLQVMANLLSNAIKHSPPSASVAVELRRCGAQAQVRVRDSGPGIDPAFRARLFEKFSQADPTDRRLVGGTGLGLYISRLLVERMGGDIVAEAPPAGGRGALFVVSLPLPRAPWLRPWVLLVDADAQARERLQRALLALDANAVVRGLAHLALQAPGSSSVEAEVDGMLPPLIVADTRGQNDAEAFCAALRRRAAGRPVLLYSDAVDAEFARRAGMAWWSKARTTPTALAEAVRDALARTERGVA